MRPAALIAFVLLASAARPQDAELIPEAYLAPKYVAPPDAPSNTVIAGRGERGERLVVTGRALDQGRPVPGVSIYAFHADDSAGNINNSQSPTPNSQTWW